MKKAISFSVCLAFLFNISFGVFAVKGDPLCEHIEYTSLIRYAFENQEKRRKDPESPFMWEKKPDFWFWDSDYRTVKVYNMPRLAAGYNSDDFFMATAKALLDARESYFQAQKISKGSRKIFLEMFVAILGDKLKGSYEINAIKDFLGTDEETAINSFICAFGMSTLAKVAHGTSIAVVLSGVLEKLPKMFGPAGAVGELAISAVLDVFCYYSTKSALEQEKTMNYAVALSTVFSAMVAYPENVLRSNVLVTAVDERNFYAIFRSSAFRRNDGAWCDFLKIGDLKCAPTAKEYKGGELVGRYIEIYRRIICDKTLDLKALESYLKCGGLPSFNLNSILDQGSESKPKAIEEGQCSAQ